MPPPSSGGIAVAATLGMLEHFAWRVHAHRRRPRRRQADGDGRSPHLRGRTARLCRPRQVRRRHRLRPAARRLADTLLNRTYLKDRAALISDRAHGHGEAGRLRPPTCPAPTTPEHGTTHISVDRPLRQRGGHDDHGRGGFGSFHMTDGFILNNQLTDFSAEPADRTAFRSPTGSHRASGRAARWHRRWSSTKAADGTPGTVMGTGSPGGSTIIQFVVKTLVGCWTGAWMRSRRSR